MNRSVEIQEILSFIESSNLQNSEEITKDCLLRFIDKLSATCDGNTQCKACPVNKYCNNYIARMRNSVDETSLKMIDLFCGAGGLSLGWAGVQSRITPMPF